MSKFTEICEVFTDATSKFDNYQKDCTDFIYLFKGKMVNYFEIPNDYLSFVKSSDPQTAFVEFKDDYFWHSSFILTVIDNVSKSSLDVKFSLRFKKESEKVFIIYFGGMKEEKIIDLNIENSINSYFDYIYNIFVNEFENNFDIITKQTNSYIIGFQ